MFILAVGRNVFWRSPPLSFPPPDTNVHAVSMRIAVKWCQKQRKEKQTVDETLICKVLQNEGTESKAALGRTEDLASVRGPFEILATNLQLLSSASLAG